MAGIVKIWSSRREKRACQKKIRIYSTHEQPLKKNIEKNKTYPEIAKKRKMSGSVSFHIETDSRLNLTECKLIKSCGYKFLDNEASKLIHNVFPLNLPDDVDYIPVNEDIRIDYQLK